MDEVLQVSLLRPTRYQRWRAEIRRRDRSIECPSAQPRVGAVIDAAELSGTLLVERVADLLAAEPGIADVAVVDRGNSGYLPAWVRTRKLERLVVGGMYDRWTGPTGTLRGVERKGVVAKFVDLGRLCARARGREEAAAKAVLLLRAAAARVRSSDALSRASIDDEMSALLEQGDGGLSPCVPALTCPAGLDLLQTLGEIGVQYPPGAAPVEVPCHLGMDRSLPTRALELGATAVVMIGCASGCARGCPISELCGEGCEGPFLSPGPGEDRPRVTMNAYGLTGLVEALDTCFSRVSPRDRLAHAKPRLKLPTCSPITSSEPTMAGPTWRDVPLIGAGQELLD